jgi:hypothetical protein
MQVVRRGLGVCAVVAAVLALPLIAQEQETTKGSDAKAARKPYDPARRVPAYFGQVGLTDAQKESIYKVRAKYVDKIDALQKQLDDLNAQMMTECETVLTEPQKKLLEQRRAMRKDRGKKGEDKGEASAPKPAQ